MTDAKPALRYHGAKYRLAKWLLPFFPPHGLYVEPFGGAAGVLLQKPRVYAEVYNDLDGDVVNYFRVLRDPMLRSQLLDAVALTPYARVEFEDAVEPSDDMVERARRLAIRAQMGFGSAGATKARTGFRIDTRRKHGTSQHLWYRFPENIAFAAERLMGVLIENRPAIDVMRQHDGASTLHFVDPPYVHATRQMGGGSRAYSHEMTDADHVDLLDMLMQLEGMVIVTGYPHSIYAEKLATWTCHQTKSRISAGRGTALRDECCWINPAAVAASASAGFGLFLKDAVA
jgi:DNA adenine methylase